MDFSLKNTKIKSFFGGDDSFPPVSELLYLHTHPLIRPNFLTEIENLVKEAEEYLIANKITGSITKELEEIAINIGTKLPELTEENSLELLKEIRKLYILCKNLLTND